MAEPDEVDLTDVTGVGASYDAPVWPTIEMIPDARYKQPIACNCFEEVNPDA